MQTNAPAVPGSWGPSPTMPAERLEACAYAVSRLTWSPARCTAPARSYFADKASQLGAACRLARISSRLLDRSVTGLAGSEGGR